MQWIPSCGPGTRDGHRVPRWLIYAIILGAYLDARGYHSFDGDQTYRLPLLLHRQDPALYADDPFVRSLDDFNPHRGALIVLDSATRLFGLSAGLFVLFTLTFLLTCRSIERLARDVWPDSGPYVGWVAVGLLLAAKAGNIGTNHLFEAMVLDRLMAFALGWLALADAVSDSHSGWWRSPMAIGLATWIHPSVGLQLAMVIAVSWLCWSFLGRSMGVSPGTALRRLLLLMLGVLPGLAMNVPRASALVGDLPDDVFWLLSVELQSPQHMLPHLWRMPQWLSWSCYFALAAIQLASIPIPRSDGTGPRIGQRIPSTKWPIPRRRLVGSMAVILLGLIFAWYAIEVLHQVRVTTFQPFRMATMARGMAILVVAGRLVDLWKSATPLGRVRSIVLASGFLGDWLLVVVTSAELVVSIVGALGVLFPRSTMIRRLEVPAFIVVLASGFRFLARHDTEYGNRTLLFALGIGLATVLWSRRRAMIPAGGSAPRIRSPWCWAGALTAAWFIPIAALLASVLASTQPSERHPLLEGLMSRCRFMAVPVDDIERLAVWCGEHTPRTARFIGPPGPKTFRLWSRRSVAFNRSASPYHAAGLSDWFARFQDHVDFHATPAEFVRAYLPDRHRFEARYQQNLSHAQRAALAVRQGASYVVAAAPTESASGHDETTPTDPLELLHIEGRYAVYRVRSAELVHRQR